MAWTCPGVQWDLFWGMGAIFHSFSILLVFLITVSTTLETHVTWTSASSQNADLTLTESQVFGA